MWVLRTVLKLRRQELAVQRLGWGWTEVGGLRAQKQLRSTPCGTEKLVWPDQTQQSSEVRAEFYLSGKY